MESCDISSLREWTPMTEVLEKIPTRIQKGIFFNNLNVTCIDVVPEFLAFGTDAGIVFWYNRFTGDVQKLRAEVSSPISCVRVVSSVEYMVAAGSVNGQVSVFQIQKEVPPDLNLVAPLTKVKPIERYTIRDLHKCPVTCCEWSKNGMKLFSGDKQGVIVLTEFDYHAHLSKSAEILNEAYGVVQLAVHQSFLVVSTIYRSIICQREHNGRWRVSQIGKKDRKILSNFGATFLDTTTKSPTIICSRPGLRFWTSDINGNVEQTLIFKEAVSVKPLLDIPLLNPGKTTIKVVKNFGIVLYYTKNFVITHDNSVLFILNLEKLRIEAVAQGFRNILDLAVCGKEIFVLEGSRSLVRISTRPEPPGKNAKIIYNPMLPPPIPVMSFPVEFEAEDEAVINAEECFELPPIEHIDLDIPIQIELDSPNTQKNKAIIEHNKRIEIFDRIADMEFEESILFKTGAAKKQRKVEKKTLKTPTNSGIVEIGRVVAEDVRTNGEDESLVKEEYKGDVVQDKTNLPGVMLTGGQMLELTSKPLPMDASFCTEETIVFKPAEVETQKSTLSESMSKKSSSVEGLIQSRHSKEQFDGIKKTQSHHGNLQALMYPLEYSVESTTKNIQTQSAINLETIDFQNCSTTNTLGASNCNELPDETPSRTSYIRSENSSSNLLVSEKDFKMPKSLQFVASRPKDIISPPVKITEVHQIPQFANIPTLWNVKIEKTEDSDQSGSQCSTSSEWEVL